MSYDHRVKERLTRTAFLLFMISAFGPCRIFAASVSDSGAIEDELPQKELVTYGSFKAGIYRDGYNIPANYGTLIDIVPTNPGAIFWFQDDKGTIRNVTLTDVSKPLVIHRQGKVTEE